MRIFDNIELRAIRNDWQNAIKDYRGSGRSSHLRAALRIRSLGVAMHSAYCTLTEAEQSELTDDQNRRSQAWDTLERAVSELLGHKYRAGSHAIKDDEVLPNRPIPRVYRVAQYAAGLCLSVCADWLRAMPPADAPDSLMLLNERDDMSGNVDLSIPVDELKLKERMDYAGQLLASKLTDPINVLGIDKNQRQQTKTTS